MSFERMFECLSEEFLAVGLSINFIQMGDRVTPVYIKTPAKKENIASFKGCDIFLFYAFFRVIRCQPVTLLAQNSSFAQPFLMSFSLRFSSDGAIFSSDGTAFHQTGHKENNA